MYREYRDLTTAGLPPSATETWGPGTAPGPTPARSQQQFHDSKIKFLLPHLVLRLQHKPRFTTKRPNAFF
ncbi:hypothetical protein P7K49_001007 [Saguinus oedipus]|uniref:Uncharacterized protein n=1 Tax=Saguinus oedipus TaxID=9490 RepID=A0ABQ9WDD1_SAGOE|nr:hypothetical protein P7K49_001007 [Saguinus oedipus]